MIDTEKIPSHYVGVNRVNDSPLKRDAGCSILLSTGQVAKIHSVTTKTVARWISEGVEVRGKKHHLGAYRAGKCWRISTAELAEFIQGLAAVLKPEIRISPAADRAAGERAVARLSKKLAPKRRKP